MAVKKRIKKPKIERNIVFEEIGRRTHLPVKYVRSVLEAYEEIVIECLKNRIEVSLGDIGTFGYHFVPPRDHIEWNGYMPVTGERVVYYQDKADGFIRLKWRFNRMFNSTFKQNTRILYGTMQSLPGTVELRPWSENIVNYDEVHTEVALRRQKQQQELTDEEAVEDYGEAETHTESCAG